MSTASHGEYFIPEPSKWPVVGTVALTTSVIGAVNTLHAGEMSILLPIGLLMIAYLFFGWFGSVIDESMAGNYNAQVDRSFRLGMMWFIFSEVMFFAAFFGALFYARQLAVPWLGGADNNVSTHEFLWPAFEAAWPLLTNPANDIVTAPKEAMGAMGLPAINTAILLTSSVTVTWAHHALRAGNRKSLNIGLGLTVLLGVCFLILTGSYNGLGHLRQYLLYANRISRISRNHGYNHVIRDFNSLLKRSLLCR